MLNFINVDQSAEYGGGAGTDLLPLAEGRLRPPEQMAATGADTQLRSELLILINIDYS